MKKLYFITGSQDLYGDDVLKAVDADSREIVQFLRENLQGCAAEIEYAGTVKNPQEILQACKKASFDDDCIGVITWMHTFSPAKMWIHGLNALTKPQLHLHTQANERLPYDKIDMDFMNLNQAAHGDREFGFINARMNVRRKVIAGYYRDKDVLDGICSWAAVAAAADASKGLKVCRFGDNMRGVAVTEGDKVEAQIRLGWQVEYYGVGDLVAEVNALPSGQVDEAFLQLKEQCDIKTKDTAAVREQVRCELALQGFLDRGGYSAFTTNFQDLHGLKQLPGLAVQRLMGRGYGFGGEGDWKIAALGKVMKLLGAGRKGGTGFMEDYTYDYNGENSLVLGAHMLEVDPCFASGRPAVEVHPLGIGGKSAPARMVFDGITGQAVAACLVDMGGRMRMLVQKIELVPPPHALPALPVARLMWKLKPDFKTGAAAWLYAGGAHHTVVSTQVTADELYELCAMWAIECVVIDEKTELNALRRSLELSEMLWSFKK